MLLSSWKEITTVDGSITEAQITPLAHDKHYELELHNSPRVSSTYRLSIMIEHLQEILDDLFGKESVARARCQGH